MKKQNFKIALLVATLVNFTNYISAANNDITSAPINNCKIISSSPMDKTDNRSKQNKLTTADVNAEFICEINSPCSIIKSTSERVINIINQGSSPNKTTLLINNVAKQTFDFNVMTKYAMGDNWKNADKSQQDKLIKNFSNLLVFTYSTTLSRFKGAKVTLNKEEMINSKRASVITQVWLPNSKSQNSPIEVKYELYKTNNTQSPWLVYNVSIENVSLVGTYRNQFNEIIQNNKIDGLIKQLSDKVASLEKTKTK